MYPLRNQTEDRNNFNFLFLILIIGASLLTIPLKFMWDHKDCSSEFNSKEFSLIPPGTTYIEDEEITNPFTLTKPVEDLHEPWVSWRECHKIGTTYTLSDYEIKVSGQFISKGLASPIKTTITLYKCPDCDVLSLPQLGSFRFISKCQCGLYYTTGGNSLDTWDQNPKDLLNKTPAQDH